MYLELRFLGGFEARFAGSVVSRFESQKARGLLAYLALHRDRALDRDFLAGLLWGERSDESARRNLRQALYSIRSTFSSSGAEALLTEGRTLQLHPDLECWIDVEAFVESFEAGASKEGPDARHLTTAAQLYKGDFLAGFFLHDSPEFEAWQMTRQEELREEALEVFRTLVAVYLARGEHRYGIRYARRLLAIDPLSEDAHRQLMRLYVMAGRRTRALAQYEHLLNLLQEELGVTPMEETTELYRSILLAGHAEEEDRDEEEPAPPLIPLVGRAEEIGFLQEEWDEAAAGRGRLTWISGEPGIGKSRLVKSFVDGATAKRNAVVLRGHCHGAAGTAAYRPFVELVGSALLDVVPDEELEEQVLSSPPLAELRRVAAQAGRVPSSNDNDDARLAITPERFIEGLLQLLELLSTPEDEPGRAVILMIDDFQWADSASRRVMTGLAAHLESRPLWIVVTSLDDSLLTEIQAPEVCRHIPLRRLSTAEVEEIASSLVDLAAVPEFAAYLFRLSDGLPLMVAEHINLLWDERRLRQRRPGVWDIEGRLAGGEDEPPSAKELIQQRIRALPTSTRRLLAMAAVYGHQFDVDILQRAADEHLSVVETCIELALERWLIRQYPRSWSPAGLERDIVLWARGARRGYFEFSHDQVRHAILEQINPIRHAVMHRDLALALEAFHGPSSRLLAEDLAFHWLAAQEPQRALPWLEQSAERAARCGDPDLTNRYVESALDVIGRLRRNADKKSSELLAAARDRLLEFQTGKVQTD